MNAFRALDSDGALDAVLAASHVSPVIILKHSETCGVSLMVRDRLVEDLLPAPVHEVVVQRQRAVSDRLAATFCVRHESPQVLVVARGEVTWHSSHNGVSPSRITAAWRQAAATFTPAPAAAR